MPCGRSANVLDEANPLYDNTDPPADRRGPGAVRHPKSPTLVASRGAPTPTPTPTQRRALFPLSSFAGLAVNPPIVTTSLICADGKLALSARDQLSLRNYLFETRNKVDVQTPTKERLLATHAHVKTPPKSVPPAGNPANDVPGLASEGLSTFETDETLLTPHLETSPLESILAATEPEPRLALPIPIPGASKKQPIVPMASVREAEVRQANWDLQQKMQRVYAEIYYLAPAIKGRQHGTVRMFDDWLNRFAKLANELCEYHYSGWLHEGTMLIALDTCANIVALNIAIEALYDECDKIRTRLTPDRQYDDYPSVDSFDPYKHDDRHTNGRIRTKGNERADEEVFDFQWD